MNLLVLPVPQTTLRLNDLLEGLTGLRKADMHMVPVCPVKGCSLKSTKGEGVWCEAREEGAEGADQRRVSKVDTGGTSIPVISLFPRHCFLHVSRHSRLIWKTQQTLET